MNRRNVLRSVAAASGVAVAGCASQLSSNGTVLGKIAIVNSSYVSNRIRLIVSRDEETLYDKQHVLSSLDDCSDSHLKNVDPLWSEAKGRYTVHAIHYDDPNQRESVSWEYTFTQADYDQYYEDEDPGCISAIVKIGSLSKEANAPIAIGPIDSENPCGR